ncbi:fimbrial biogenesis chaperone [Providencia sp. PROV230]|uniref:fimbrial biogenesis chaperone n=1 Tax=Providencia sp. PROV230 TaxID=2949922 RepID=UPI0023492FD5|nr:molecular chaperone [Providencia sp. PROV230]
MLNQYSTLKVAIVAGFISLFFASIKVGLAEGGISLSQTRVVFEQNAKSKKVLINNQSDQVYLIDSRVLSTPDGLARSTDRLPFMVTPPLFRLEKNSNNAVLINRNDTSTLAKDRESLFYLSFLAIPSVKPSAESAESPEITTTQVSFGIRTVIKLFYRPTGLDMPVSLAPEKLTVKQGKNQLQITNPTPYYLTLAELFVNDQPISIREQGAMLAPFSTQYYNAPQVIIKQVLWSVINDFGGLSQRFTWTNTVTQ